MDAFLTVNTAIQVLPENLDLNATVPCPGFLENYWRTKYQITVLVFQIDDKETLLREKKQRKEEVARKEREKVCVGRFYLVDFIKLTAIILFSKFRNSPGAFLNVSNIIRQRKPQHEKRQRKKSLRREEFRLRLLLLEDSLTISYTLKTKGSTCWDSNKLGISC